MTSNISNARERHTLKISSSCSRRANTKQKSSEAVKHRSIEAAKSVTKSANEAAEKTLAKSVAMTVVKNAAETDRRRKKNESV